MHLKFISFSAQTGSSVMYVEFPDIAGIEIMLISEARNRFVEKA